MICRKIRYWLKYKHSRYHLKPLDISVGSGDRIIIDLDTLIHAPGYRLRIKGVKYKVLWEMEE